MVELDAHRAAGVAHRHGLVEPAVLDPQVVEQPQRLAGEVPEFGMTAFRLELGHDDDRDDDLVLVEPQQGARIRQEDGGVEDVGASGAGIVARSGHVGLLKRATCPVTRCLVR